MFFKDSDERTFWLPEEDKMRTKFDNKARIKRTTREMASTEIKRRLPKGFDKKIVRTDGNLQYELNKY